MDVQYRYRKNELLIAGELLGLDQSTSIVEMVLTEIASKENERIFFSMLPAEGVAGLDFQGGLNFVPLENQVVSDQHTITSVEICEDGQNWKKVSIFIPD